MCDKFHSQRVFCYLIYVINNIFSIVLKAKITFCKFNWHIFDLLNFGHDCVYHLCNFFYLFMVLKKASENRARYAICHDSVKCKEKKNSARYAKCDDNVKCKEKNE